MSIAATTYQWYLAVHILAAVTWVGGALVTQLYAFRATRTNDGVRIANFAQDAEWIGMRIFLPSSLILVIFGFMLVGERNWDWSFWLVFALAVWLLSVVVGAAFLGPESGRIAKVIDREGPNSAEATARLKRIFLVSRVELVFLLLVVLDMALKPGS
ncbi:MAG: DUF2269 family protein [Conexibacter sp.]